MISLMLTVFSWSNVLCAAAVTWVVGTLWYSPFLFGNRWIALSDVKLDRSLRMFACMGLDFFTLFIQASIVAWLLENCEAWTILDAFIVVSVISIGCGIFQLLAITAWERRSWELFAIHAGGILVAFFLITSMLVYMAFQFF